MGCDRIPNLVVGRQVGDVGSFDLGAIVPLGGTYQLGLAHGFGGFGSDMGRPSQGR